ncbi:MAG: class I SAM-dependent methyltransferase [Eubacteriales bacterium]|nr:class I SAM-dependent methyltransferase [Eubacteriales bacterium]
MKNQTLEYYNENANEFCKSTVQCDMNSLYRPFLERLPENARILDLGCGSGRDTKEFLNKGYRVTAVDGAETICRFATEYTGQKVRCLSFEKLDYVEEFDGVWACASLLHVEKTKIEDVIKRIHIALISGGTLYVSFKYGSGEIERNGRLFNNYMEEDMKTLFSKDFGWGDLKCFITSDVRQERTHESWINVLVNKKKV